MITYEMTSEAGSRLRNEDQVGMERLGNEYGFFLADGLGGYGWGETASYIAIEEAKEQFFREGASWDCLDRIFLHAQESITFFQKEHPESSAMKTTLCTLLIGETDIRWGHIGDSRVYCFENGILQAQTKDHSVPQMLASSGMIDASEIRFHPDRNRLLQCMGIPWEGKPYDCAAPFSRTGEHAFLLCSDGFWEWVREREMEAALQQSENPSEWLDIMGRIIEKNGKGKNMDNYSAIAVWISEPG